MREVIEEYVEGEEKCEAFRLNAVNAWEVFQATGRYTTAGEVAGQLGN
ncbi:hypothetical protein [Marinobacterium rhizophilum]|nr:hypothetical protein [Marinobacterium rhizophilum]